MTRSRMVALLATATVATCAAPAAATTIGSLPATGASNSSCGPFTAWQHTPSQAQGVATIVTGWSTYQRSGAGGRTARLKVLHAVGANSWKVVGESPVLDVGTTEGVKSQAVSIPVAAGDFVALFANGADCYYTHASADQLDGHSGAEPAVGDTIDDNAGVSPVGYTLDLQATAELDADGDGFGDETQDSCPADPSIHAGACIADLGVSATVTPSTIGVGDVAVMTGGIGNAGSGLAQGVVLHAAAGAGLQVVGSFPSAGCVFATDLACPVGSLAANGSAPFVVIVKGVAVGVQTLTASVTGSTTDPNAANDAAAGQVTVEQRVPLVCTVPKLTGLSKAFAKQLLQAVHCKLGKAAKKKAKKGRRGTVIKQAKKAKTVLPAGSKVNVTLKK